MTIREIELHPGHWYNIGSGANGILNEVTEARKVTKRVCEILKAASVPCTYFEDNTSSNQSQNLGTLVKHHNADRDGLIVSIHFNASGDTQNKAIGTEVLYFDQRELAEKVAKAISDVTGGGLLNRGAKQNKGLAIMAQTYEPAVLIEVCFVNSTVDAAIYRRDFEKICQSIAKALAEYIGKPIEPLQAASSTGQEVTSKEEDIMEQKFDPSIDVLRNAVRGVLVGFEQQDPALSQEWRLKFDRGELSVSDGLAILFEAINRGYIPRKEA